MARWGRTASRIARSRATEKAPALAAHESPETTELDHRTGDRITLDEIERIRIRRLPLEHPHDCRGEAAHRPMDRLK